MQGPFDINRMIRRSLPDLIDVEESSSLFNNSPISPSEDNIELSFCDLADNSLSFWTEAGRTSEIKSPLDIKMAPPTNISNVGSYSPSSVSNILRGSLKNDQSLDFNSHHRQGYGNQEQLQIQPRQFQTRSESISDQSISQSQMWQYNIKSEYHGSKW